MVADVVEPTRQRVDDPDRAAVGDHQHRLVRVPLEHVGEEGGDTLAERGEGLSVVRACSLAGEPAAMRVTEGELDLGGRQTFPGAKGALAQPSIQSHGQAEHVRDNLCGLTGTRQVARVQDVDVAKLPRDLACLVAAGVVEVRVRMPLPAAVAIPARFAMADEKKGRHETD